MRYKILHEYDKRRPSLAILEALSRQVNEAIRLGWRPQGGVAITQVGTHNEDYHDNVLCIFEASQAMVHDGEEP